MRAHFLTDRLFDGTALHAAWPLRLTVEGGRITYVGDHATGPAVAAGEEIRESSHRQWGEVYDRDRVAQLRAAR